ncbi:YbhB/YbcL family Raf kinase inhibitor-like protein [Desulfovibrio ferrophilus]|uniref:Phosphatidylethanolamine-binding protein n=1 Tax=Desulfovibrio ferrophilus TaxID=241368 RepID=A0A2Z6B0F8_9BACT|nr:YbhB/YbcL family Raf kinase inhibitor-like protein [Desulfovibrio ferrophilus]BBD08876.1 phosphatidylethanolamine-binding protein [Desulfovibrio ferrophilus]
MKLFSTSFDEGAAIPIQYTCDASDFSPALEWEDAPEGTKTYALICDDPDAPAGTWTHWLIYGIPGIAFRLAAKIPAQAEHPSGLRQGLNSWNRIGYGGPCPPSGTHRYFFTLYALDCDLDLAPEARREELEQAMEGHVLASAQTMGTYTR